MTGVRDVAGKSVVIVLRASTAVLRSAVTLTATVVAAVAAAAAAVTATAQGSRRAVVQRDNGRVAHRLRCRGGGGSATRPTDCRRASGVVVGIGVSVRYYCRCRCRRRRRCRHYHIFGGRGVRKAAGKNARAVCAVCVRALALSRCLCVRARTAGRKENICARRDRRWVGHPAGGVKKIKTLPVRLNQTGYSNNSSRTDCRLPNDNLLLSLVSYYFNIVVILS